MRVLILGGTVFLGRHLVECGLERGHDLAIFTRGRTAPELYPDVEHLTGDRRDDLTVLAGREYDAVIDTSGYLPGDVARSAAQLSSLAGAYAFVSSRSIYADHSSPGMTEDAALAQLPAGADPEVVDGETYGPLKALCERAVVDAFAGRVLILRPGLIVGPYDPSGRFTHWVDRFGRPGRALVPAPADRPVQVIDARDLSLFTYGLLEAGTSGTFDTVNPAGAVTMGAVIDACRAAGGSVADPVWVDEAFLLDRGVAPWTELPLWTPGDEMRGFQLADVSRAVAAGLRVRPIAETVEATRDWLATLPAPPIAGGMTPCREAELLAEWDERHTRVQPGEDHTS